MESKGTYRLDDLVIDLQQQAVTRNKADLDITGLSFRLLAYFVSRGTNVVTFDNLMETVWAGVTVNEETITQRVKLLRQALGDNSRAPRYIRTVRGQGYQLISEPKKIKRTSGTSKITWIGIGFALAASITIAITLNQKEPQARKPLLERAKYYAGIGQLDDNERAIELYLQVLKKEPENVAAQLGLSFVYNQRVCKYNQPSRWAVEAEELAQKVLAAWPDEADAHTALAYAYDCQGMIGKAIGGYEAAVALDPGNAAALASAAHLYQIQGDLATALEKNLAAKKLNADIRYMDIQIARILELLGYINEAEALYENTFRLYPDNIFGNVTYPQFLFVQGRMEEAEAALEIAEKRNIERKDLLVLKGELALLRREPDQAILAFSAAANINPNQGYPKTLSVLFGKNPNKPAWADTRMADIRRDIENGDHWHSNWIELALLAPSPEAALIELNHAVDVGFLDKNYLLTSPLFASFRNQPGFPDIIEKINRRIIEERGKLPDIRAMLSEYNPDR